MAEYTIPEEQRSPLNKLRTISDATFNEMAASMERSPNDVPAVQGVSSDEASLIREAVVELYRVREFFADEIHEFTSGIANGLREALDFPESEVSGFQNRLIRLLTINPLGIAAKAASLKLEYERRFCSARIMTDARPIYTDSPSKPPSAVMIAHTLRIAFHDNTSEMREVYFRLDDGDLVELRKLIIRAEEKAKSLQTVFAAANIPLVLSN